MRLSKSLIFVFLWAGAQVLAFPAHSNSIRGFQHPHLARDKAGIKATSSDAESTTAPQYVVLLSRSSHAASPTHARVGADVGHILSRVGLHVSHPSISHTYNNSGFRGFSGSLSADTLASLSTMDEVEHVEPVVRVSTNSDVSSESDPDTATSTTRPSSPWGLQRLSQPSSLSSLIFNTSLPTFNYTYTPSPAEPGAGADIYTLDTGLLTTHAALSPRARMGFSIEGAADLTPDSDENGHGTHVAGTAAGSVFGVASGANVIGVKVLDADGTGSSADCLRGLDFVIQAHAARRTSSGGGSGNGSTNGTSSGFVGSVANLSWALPSNSSALASAIAAAVQEGIHVVAAAGNEGRDACAASPASSGGEGGPAITVGSIGAVDDRVSSFSNWGDCVDVYAPGEGVLSSWIGEGGEVVKLLSGTSMATPHVTGLVAYHISRNASLALAPAAMKAFLASAAGSVGLTGSGGTGGRVAWNGEV